MIEYKIIRAKRKTVSLSVNDDLQVIVRAPYYADKAELDSFVNSNLKWIEKAMERKRVQLEKCNLSDDEIAVLVDKARAIIPKRVNYYASLMNLKPAGIKITKAKKRFGSCSGRNSLCFSCYLMLYPPEAVDYVVVHELAHIKHHNHSKDFYNLISQYMPNYKSREKILKQ